jgi:hypothetical protein
VCLSLVLNCTINGHPGISPEVADTAFGDEAEEEGEDDGSEDGDEDGVEESAGASVAEVDHEDPPTGAPTMPMTISMMGP